MKAAIISLKSQSSQMIAKAMKKYFDEVDSIDLRGIEVNLESEKIEILNDGQPFKKYDCVFSRGSFRFAPLLRSISLAVKGVSYTPIKPGAFTIGHDKLLTHLALRENNIPMPTTYLASGPESAKSILEKVNYPIIMKLPSGTGGKGVMYAESFAAASSVLDTLTTLRQPFIIQEYVETGGVDIRAIVVGGKIVAAMKRKAVVGEKRSNIHAGGVGEAFLLDQHMKKIALETAKAIQADVCAVDILESAKGPVVIEANLSPGLQGITVATGIDVADKVARYLFEKSRIKTESGKSVATSRILEELGIKTEEAQQIITNLQFRANRILLPKIVTDVAKFSEKDELILKIKKGKLIIEKSGIS